MFARLLWKTRHCAWGLTAGLLATSSTLGFGQSAAPPLSRSAADWEKSPEVAVRHIAADDAASYGPGLIGDPAEESYVYPRRGQLQFSDGQLVAARRKQEQPPVEQPLTPTAPEIVPVSIAGGLADVSLENIQPRLSTPSEGAADAAMGGSAVLFRPTRDVGGAILEAPSVNNTSLFRRPAATEPHIRGFHHRQIYTQLNGGYWLPARWDLDTIVSKLDAGIVADVIIIKGPYSAVYGPSFSYIDVVTVPTPRYCCGHGFEGRTVMNYDTNGEAWYARQAFQGGGVDWGFRGSFGFRTANDFKSGQDDTFGSRRIRGSYKHRDIDFAVGYDLSPYSRVQFDYIRLDLTDAEFFNQPTDIDFLVTNGDTGRYELDYTPYFDHLRVEGWYNRTRLAQSGLTAAFNPANPFNFEFLFVSTYADITNWGQRVAVTWGDYDCSHLTVGADYREVEQEILERDIGFGFNVVTNTFNFVDDTFDLPKSRLTNPGVFFQATDYIDCDWAVTVGGRWDWVKAKPLGLPRSGPGGFTGTLNPFTFNPTPGHTILVPVERNYDLWSAFVTTEYQVNCEWTVFAGGGHAERAPTLTELYVDQTFLAGNQRGFNFFIGNPALDKERLWQIDVGTTADYANMRGSLRGFYAWVDDYITYNRIAVNPEFPGPLSDGYRFVNRDATLAGFELNSEYDLTRTLTAFGSLAYVEGRDRDINEPLFGIYPLQSRVGIRGEYGNYYSGWGWEFSARIVDNQDRIAGSLGEQFTAGFTTYDLRTYWRLSPNLLLTAGVTNLTNKAYFEHYDYRVNPVDPGSGQVGVPSFQPGRNYFFGGEVTY